MRLEAYDNVELVRVSVSDNAQPLVLSGSTTQISESLFTGAWLGALELDVLTATISDSELSDNNSDAFGAAIRLSTDEDRQVDALVLERSRVFGNQVWSGVGGAVYSEASTLICRGEEGAHHLAQRRLTRRSGEHRPSAGRHRPTDRGVGRG